MGDFGVSRARAAGLVGAAMWCAACAPSGADASEVAAELRALRLALANQGAASDPERAALSAAVAAVGKTQHELAERQAALQAELKGWAQLVAHDADAQRSAEAKALAARVAELDAELQQQKLRQAELEAVLRQTLDRAADRIDALLQRRDGATAAPAAGAGASGPAVGGAVTPVGGFAFDVRLLWAAVAAAGVVTASYVLRGKPVSLAATAGASDGADDGVPPEAIAPFTTLAAAGQAVVAGAAGAAPPGCEVLVVAPARATATLAALAAEPLVLRRPAPLAMAGAAGVEVRYWLAPACTPAARLRLRQRLLASR